ncbi:MAG: hypothetical protein SAJ12_03830 [Jaaginema sp. PMC 1079.18]|nr:hypothetical protein [Jaaginema sp. PMC 1080.18]MEC4850119.1 hypothetical protein [Jaaginema sp. PMC 1079.18]MEC4864793.1 hypothetical protein [Jaaginema sp. PMC 1078.18]
MVDEPQRLVQQRLEQSRLEGQLRARNAAIQQDAAKPQTYYRGFDCKTGQVIGEKPGGGTHRAGALASNGMVQEGTPLKQMRGGIPNLTQKPAANITPLAAYRNENLPKLKILFAVRQDGTDTWDFFVGGDRKTPTKIHTGTYLSSPSATQNALVSTGKGRNSWRFTTENSSDFIWKSGQNNQVYQPKSSVDGEIFDPGTIDYKQSPSLFKGTTIRHGVYLQQRGFNETGSVDSSYTINEWWNIVSWGLDINVNNLAITQYSNDLSITRTTSRQTVKGNYWVFPNTLFAKEIVINFFNDTTFPVINERKEETGIIVSALVDFNLRNVLYQQRKQVEVYGTPIEITDKYFLGTQEIDRDIFTQLSSATELKENDFHFIPLINSRSTDRQEVAVEIRSLDSENLVYNFVTVEVLPLFKKNQIPNNYVVLSRSFSL